jgi:hypothetical protein
MSTAEAKPPTARAPAASAKNHAFILIRGIIGAAVGAFVGYFVFRWLVQARLYGIMVPGLLLGLGAGLAARGPSQGLGILCGLAAVVVTVFDEWSVFPFVKDRSFGFFVAHVHELPPIKLALMGLGAVAAYWFGQGR